MRKTLATAGAAKFRVLITEPSGRKTIRTVTHAGLTVPGAVRSVSVRAVGFDNRVAASRTVNVKR